MPTGETIRLPNGRLWEVHIGGSGPDLVWLHGISGLIPGDPMIAALERHHRVIAPLAPGFNGLEEIDEIGNIHELALDYDDLFDHFKLEGTAIVGHSFGAMVGAEVAAHFPRRASKLVLLAPVGMWNDAYPVTDIFAEPFAMVEGLLWHDKAARDTLASRRSNVAGPQSEAERLIAVAQGLTAVTKFVWPIPDKGLRRRLPRIAASTLLVFGAEDGFVPPRYAEDFAIGLKRVKSTVIEGAGHMVPYEKTDEVVGLIEKFLAA